MHVCRAAHACRALTDATVSGRGPRVSVLLAWQRCPAAPGRVCGQEVASDRVRVCQQTRWPVWAGPGGLSGTDRRLTARDEAGERV